jgi:hypothetical protein
MSQTDKDCETVARAMVQAGMGPTSEAVAAFERIVAELVRLREEAAAIEAGEARDMRDKW